MHKYCSKCGKELTMSRKELVKTCVKCEAEFYPKISPAIIVAVIKDDKILLARNKNFRENMFSVIAGYVDSGETLEQCVEREVQEEVSIKIKNVKYFGSQSWPYTNSLMMGFTAEYSSGDIQVDNEEIVEADWFSYDNLPIIPGKYSIANELINWFVSRYSKVS
jgi:NAD+ diphosphatase